MGNAETLQTEDGMALTARETPDGGLEISPVVDPGHPHAKTIDRLTEIRWEIYGIHRGAVYVATPAYDCLGQVKGLLDDAIADLRQTDVEPAAAE